MGIIIGIGSGIYNGGGGVSLGPELSPDPDFNIACGGAGWDCAGAGADISGGVGTLVSSVTDWFFLSNSSLGMEVGETYRFTMEPTEINAPATLAVWSGGTVLSPVWDTVARVSHDIVYVSDGDTNLYIAHGTGGATVKLTYFSIKKIL
jgi:hypothetical protein